MVSELIKMIIRKSTLKENRLLVSLGLILTLLLVVTFFKFFGSALIFDSSQAHLALLAALIVTLMLTTVLSLLLVTPLKLSQFNSRIRKSLSLEDLFIFHQKEGEGSGNLAGELNVDEEKGNDDKDLSFNSSRESLLENVLSSMNEGLFLVDREGRPRVLNKKAHEIIELACKNSNECLEHKMGAGESADDILGFCEMGWVVRELREERAVFDGGRYVREIHTKDNRDFSLTVTNLMEGKEKGGYIISVRDVTDDKEIQRELFLSNKLVALGEMAAGIAHEVNNPLQIMMGNIDLLEHWLNEDELGAEKIKDLREGIFKIKSIVNNMLVFARQETLAMEDVDVNSVISSAIDSVRGQLITSGITVERDLQSGLMPVKCNKNLLQQVITSVIRNSKDSMEEFKKGSLIHIHSNQYNDDKVVIVITDDGQGIPGEILDRVFDPFFTTKDVGKGKGLGLSVSKRIIESMGGDIKVSSVEGISATFYITLTTSSITKDRLYPEEFERDFDLSLLLNKKVLMVEDEDLIVDVVKPIITPMVDKFDTFNSKSDAYALLSSNEYDIILLDIGESELDSMDVYDWIKDKRPHLTENIIFLTGDIESEKMRGLLSLTGIPAIKKPFETKDLLSIVTSRIEEKEVRK